MNPFNIMKRSYLGLALLLSSISFSQTTSPKLLGYSAGTSSILQGNGVNDTYRVQFNGGQVVSGKHQVALAPPANSQCLLGFKYGLLLTPNTFEKEMFVSKGYFPDYIQLSWEVARFQSQITGYKIFRRDLGSSSAFVQVANISNASTSWKDEFAEASKMYEYKLKVEGIFPIEIPFINILSGIGFRLPSGKVSGRITFKGGGSVSGATIIPETSDNFAGSSLDLNGSTSYLAISPNSSDTKFSFANSFTFQAWIKPSKTTNSTLFQKDTQYKISHQKGQITFNANGTNLVLPFTEKADTFFNVTAVRSADSLFLYVLYDNDVYYKKSVKFTGTTPANTSEIFIGKSATNTDYYGGNIDEMRIWSRALPQSEILKESFRLISGTEDGLSGYYRLNEGVGSNFYDLSRKGFAFNENHGFMSNVSWSTKVPLRAQLSVKGYTDANGNYLITGIPYTSDGSTYRIVPAFGVHSFEPTERLLFIGPGSNVYSDVNFEDIASFLVTGKIFYKNTKFPVQGVNIKIDGVTSVNSDGNPISSDALGEFKLDVPIGKHQIQLVKHGHVFRNDGYFPDANSTFDFQQNYTIQQNFIDTTLVKVIGKVVGGPVEEAKSDGLGRSINNIGHSKIVLTTQKEYDLKSSSPDSIGKWRNEFIFHKTGALKKYGETNFKVLATNPKNIEIKPDPTTGEYYAYLLPERYVIKSIVAGNPDATSPNYKFDESFHTVLDLTSASLFSTSRDSIVDVSQFKVNPLTKDTTFTYLFDSVTYNVKKNFILRLKPMVTMTSNKVTVPRFWESEITAKDGSKVSVVSSDNYGAWLTPAPIFIQRNTYKTKLSVFEEYINVDDGNKKDKVPVVDGKVSIQNELAIDTKLTTFELNKFGILDYEFKGGLPNLTTGGIGSFQKSMTVKVFTGKNSSIVTDWPSDGMGFKGYVFGGMPTGNNFVTTGPNVVSMILRDPQGSNSYAFYETGTSNSTEISYEVENGETVDANATLLLGTKTTSFAGIGAGVIIEAEVTNDVTIGIEQSTNFIDANTEVTTTTNTRKWSTSAEPDFVGANGDVFIGNSTNIIYGKNIIIDVLSDTECDPTTECIKIATVGGGTYNIGKKEAVRIGTSFATGFQYTQNHIENYLIPQLKELRNNYYLKKRNTAVTGGKMEYVCVICDGDQYANSNDGKKITRQVGGIIGDSYSINLPARAPGDTTEYVDSVMWYNSQIKSWENILERNEKEKLESSLVQNYSYDAGSVFESSTTVENSDSRTETFTFTINPYVSGNKGANLQGFGVQLNFSATYNHLETETTTTNTTTSSTFGFVLNDGDEGDFYSIDVRDAKKGTGPVFKVRGGQSMCPYVGAEISKYHDKGKILSEATMRREKPQITVNQAIVNNVPQGRDANFILNLSNPSESGDDAWYRLSIDESTIVGGNLKIDGASISNGRTFFIPAGGTVNKALNLSQAIPDSFKFENVKLVLHSLCQFDPGDNLEDISDTVEISAYFQPSCTPIKITDPSDKWLVNSSNMIFSGTENTSIPNSIGIDGYDLNHSTFEKILVQYKSASSSQWITDMIYYVNQSDFNKASLPKTWINGKASIDYILEMKSLQDRNYDVRLQTVCADGTFNISDVATGIKDVKRPKLFGTPQPGDGILSPGDDIMVTLDEDIQQGLLTSLNFSVKGVLNGGDIAHNSVLYFDGVDDNASVVEGVKLSDKSFTVEFWTKRLTDGQNEVIFNQGNLELGFNAANNFYGKFGSQTFATSVSFPAIDVWQHYAVSYNDETKKVSFYKDDQIVLDNVDVTALFEPMGRMNIGTSLTNSNAYKGYIHDFRVWETAKGQGSIIANMNKTQTGDEVGLSGFWPMDEADGLVALDLSRNHHAVLNGASWAVFPRGNARNFSGSDHLTIPAGEIIATNEMDMTIEFWMKAGPQTNKVLFSNGKGDGTDASPPFENIWVFGSNNEGKLQVLNNGNVLTLNKDVFDNKWHHVALVVKRIANTSLYIDGNQEVFKQSSNFGGISGAQITLGARQFRSGGSYVFDQKFVGKLDEVRIWNLARTKKLIELDKNSKLKGDEIGLMAYYPFDAYDVNLILQPSLKDQKVSSNKLASIVGGSFDNADVPNLKDARPVQNVTFDWVVNEDQIIINVKEDPELIEKTILEITVQDIEDLNENRLASPITWTAFIRKNTVLWNETELSFEKKLYEKVTFNVDIFNRGGTEQNYTVSNLPSWLSISEPSGSLAPASKKTLNFEISESVNIGNYEESIYLGSDFGFLEKLEINLKVKGNEPDWTVEGNNFEYNMSIIGTLNINGIVSTNPDDKIAAFVNGELRGVANLQYVAAYDQYEFFLDVFSNETNGENIEFKVWNASEGKIQVEVTPQVSFEKNGIVGSPSTPTQFIVTENVVIAYPLKKGWNWLSFNVNSPSLASSNKLLTELNSYEGDVVKTIGKFDQFGTQTGWIGEISKQGGFSLQNCYKVKSTIADTFHVVGSSIETTSISIPLLSGWNWIGFPSEMTMRINDAMANVNFANGDFIKGQNGFAIYDQYLGWIGSLKFLQATKGYMLKTASNYSLTYPNPELLARARATETKDIIFPKCNAKPEDFEKDMSFVIKLDLCNSAIDVANDYLMVSVNGECRGAVEPTYLQSNNTYVFFLTALSNSNGEKLEFSFYDASSDKVYPITETYTFIADAIEGSLNNPYLMKVTSSSSLCNLSSLPTSSNQVVSVYPNPFATDIKIQLIQDISEIGKVYITDIQGKIIADFKVEEKILWDAKAKDGSEVPSGVYLINVETNHNTFKVKLVKE